jgi:hypothetical protein
VNPSATVLAVAERNVLGFVRRQKKDPLWPEGDTSPGAVQLSEQRQRAKIWARTVAAEFDLAPPEVESPPVVSQPVGLQFSEQFTGHLSKTTREPRSEAEFYELESVRGVREAYRVELQVTIADMDRFLRDPDHRAHARGTIEFKHSGSSRAESFSTEGDVRLLVDSERVPELARAAPERLFVYDLRCSPASGQALTLRMYKRAPRVLNRFTWRATSRCFSRIHSCETGATLAAGVLRVDMSRFVRGTLPSMQVTGTEDPARVLWVLGTFAQFFVGGLSSTTVSQLRRLTAPTARSAQG